MTTKAKRNLSFIFTPDGFRMDDCEDILSDTALAWKKRFEEDKFLALYNLGFLERPAEFDSAGCFLYRLSDCFFHVLTAQADIELSRESAEIRPDGDMTGRLLRSLPFTLGSEYVTEQWISDMFERLNSIFVKEIQEYEGTVAMYLAGKSQHLKVAERIFFI